MTTNMLILCAPIEIGESPVAEPPQNSYRVGCLSIPLPEPPSMYSETRCTTKPKAISLGTNRLSARNATRRRHEWKRGFVAR